MFQVRLESLKFPCIDEIKW
jgi:hypothetical protein